jgi:lysophospholipase L1-like esterase
MNNLKRIFFIVVGSLSVQCVYAQLKYDTSYFTTYYEQKVTLFKLLPPTKNDIVFLGNSITDIGEWAEIWQNKHVKNRGISGDNTFGVLARLNDLLFSKPNKIFIMIGINDISKDTPDSIIISNYQKIINIIRITLPKTKLYVQSILPTNNEFNEFKRHQNKNEHIRFINDAVENYCDLHKVTFVDLYPSFLDEVGRLSKMYTNDGLHINGYGYMHWRSLLMLGGYMK